MSEQMPDRNQHIHGDETGTWPSDADMTAIHAAALREIADTDHWHEVVGTIDLETAQRIAQCMDALDKARGGDALAVQAVLVALSRLQKHAARVAEEMIFDGEITVEGV